MKYLRNFCAVRYAQFRPLEYVRSNVDASVTVFEVSKYNGHFDLQPSLSIVSMYNGKLVAYLVNCMSSMPNSFGLHE